MTREKFKGRGVVEISANPRGCFTEVRPLIRILIGWAFRFEERHFGTADAEDRNGDRVLDSVA